MKRCKQCTRELDDEQFKSYVPRGTGKYKTSVGRHTICKECEKINNRATKLFKLESPTEEDVAALGRFEAAYKQLASIGGQPVGVYARHVLGIEEPLEHTPRRKAVSDEDLLMAVLGGIQVVETETTGDAEENTDDVTDTIATALQCYLDAEWSDVPDTYSDELDAIVEPGKVKEEHKDLYDACLRKCYAYEDEYTW